MQGGALTLFTSFWTTGCLTQWPLCCFAKISTTNGTFSQILHTRVLKKIHMLTILVLNFKVYRVR